MKLKQIVAGTAIAGALGFSAMGIGTAVALADPPPFVPGPHHDQWRGDDRRGYFHDTPWGEGPAPWGWGAPPPPVWGGPLPAPGGPPPAPINYWGFQEQPVWDPGFSQWGFWFFGVWIPL